MVHVFFLRGREDFVAAVGQPAGGWTEPGAGAVLVAATDSTRPALRHEFGHLYSHQRWGRPAADWISEGVAVFAAGHCAGRSLHVWAAAASAQGESMSIASLEQAFDFTRAAPHMVAGSFVQHVAEEYGISAVHSLWRVGLRGIEPAIGQGADGVQAAWLERVRGLADEVDEGMDATRRVGCES